MNVRDEPFFFPCAGERLLAMLSRPPRPGPIGVLVIVGGPQYRVGSHRQFLLLARHLAAQGVACLRFDYRGMGDASGAMRDFDTVSEDVRGAIDVFLARVPELSGVVRWGLCDGASAACFYAPTDPRVRGMVLLNPWIRTEVGKAKAYLRHYYFQRLLSPEFWRKVAGGRFEVGKSLAGLRSAVAAALEGRRAVGSPGAAAADRNDSAPLPERMARSLARFRGEVLIVLSGKDYVAAEFRDAVAASAAMKRALSGDRVSWHRLADADHTFSTAAWRDQVAQTTRDWIAGRLTARTTSPVGAMAEQPERAP